MNINKGMYIEKLIENTILYYINNSICILEKRYLPIQIIKNNHDGTIVGKLLSKSYVDFFGIVNQKFVAFETKQTDQNYFDLNQIKKHQFDYLKKIKLLKGISFIILHFFNDDKTYLIDFEYIEKSIIKKTKKIYLKSLDKQNNNLVHKLELIFPGILNLYEKIIKIQ